MASSTRCFFQQSQKSRAQAHALNLSCLMPNKQLDLTCTVFSRQILRIIGRWRANKRADQSVGMEGRLSSCRATLILSLSAARHARVTCAVTPYLNSELSLQSCSPISSPTRTRAQRLSLHFLALHSGKHALAASAVEWAPLTRAAQTPERELIQQPVSSRILHSVTLPPVQTEAPPTTREIETQFFSTNINKTKIKSILRKDSC